VTRNLPPAVVFDIGGVLVRISNTWQEAAKVAGVAVTLSTEPLYLEDLPGFHEYQTGDWDEERYLSALAGELGITPAEALRVHNGILIEPFPGTAELVAELESKGVITGVLSNTNKPHWDVLDNPSFYAVVAGIKRKMPSHLVGVQKPNPRIFELYMERFGLAPKQVFFFDDNVRNVAAALSLGWRATQIDPLANPVSQMRLVLEKEGVLGW